VATLKEKISLLIQLQECDTSIQKISKKIEDAPHRIQGLQEELEAAEMKSQEDRDKLEALKKESRTFDQEIDDFDIKFEKSNTKLSNIKSNKEYTAALKEVEDLKNEKVRTEDKVISLMEAIEEGQRGCLENDTRQKQLQETFEETQKKVERKIDDLNGALEVFKKKRDNLKASIEKDLLDKYLFLWERRQGVAISPVTGGVCQTCHMGIPPQKFNELRKGDVLMSCSHCKRIIYWADDAHYQATTEDQGDRPPSSHQE